MCCATPTASSLKSGSRRSKAWSGSAMSPSQIRRRGQRDTFVPNEANASNATRRPASAPTAAQRSPAAIPSCPIRSRFWKAADPFRADSALGSRRGSIMAKAKTTATYLCSKDSFFVLVTADDSDDAYRKGGKLLGIVAGEVEDIDLDVCVKIENGVPVDLSDQI